MTIASLLIGTIIAQALFIATKVLFFNYLNEKMWLVFIGFFVLLAIETIAVVRRMGTLNYFESFFLAIVWFFAILISDFVITATLIGRDMFSNLTYWISYLVIIIALLLFHKKLHVEVRKANVQNK